MDDIGGDHLVRTRGRELSLTHARRTKGRTHESDSNHGGSDTDGLGVHVRLNQVSMKMQQAFHLSMPVTPADHTIGPREALVTVVEYGDFECPHCKQAAPAVKLLLERFSGRIRFVYRHFPLEEVHLHALQAAEAAETAGAQGKFWKMHDLLFDNQPHLKAGDLGSYAARLQLDMTRYATEMKDRAYLQRIREHQQGGSHSGVRSTPTFFVNRSIHDVSFGLTRLFEAVEDQLGPARQPRRR